MSTNTMTWLAELKMHLRDEERHSDGKERLKRHFGAPRQNNVTGTEASTSTVSAPSCESNNAGM